MMGKAKNKALWVEVEDSWPLKAELISGLMKMAKWAHDYDYQKEERKAVLDFIKKIGNGSTFSECHFDYMRLNQKEIKALFGELE